MPAQVTTLHMTRQGLDERELCHTSSCCHRHCSCQQCEHHLVMIPKAAACCSIASEPARCLCRLRTSDAQQHTRTHLSKAPQHGRDARRVLPQPAPCTSPHLSLSASVAMRPRGIMTPDRLPSCCRAGTMSSTDNVLAAYTLLTSLASRQPGSRPSLPDRPMPPGMGPALPTTAGAGAMAVTVGAAGPGATPCHGSVAVAAARAALPEVLDAAVPAAACGIGPAGAACGCRCVRNAPPWKLNMPVSPACSHTSTSEISCRSNTTTAWRRSRLPGYHRKRAAWN